MEVDYLTRISGLLAGMAAEIPVDGITLWLADGEDLVATVNPLEPELIGLRQPVQRGLISQVYLTGQAILEQSPAMNPQHDPSVDRLTGRTCAFIMAVPVVLQGARGEDGVISAVRFAGGCDGEKINLADMEKISRLSEKIAGLPRLSI